MKRQARSSRFALAAGVCMVLAGMAPQAFASTDDYQYDSDMGGGVLPSFTGISMGQFNVLGGVNKQGLQKGGGSRMIFEYVDFLGASGEAARRMAAAGRADAPAHGGQRSACVGSWRDIGSESCVWSVAKGHCEGHARNRSRNGTPARSRPTARCGAEEDHR